MDLSTIPPLEKLSAERFRRWLAGMVCQDKPASQTDRDGMKTALIAFLAACPHVYELKDRMVLWEKIGNAATAALENCNNDLMVWVNLVFEGIDGNPGRIAASEPIKLAIDTLNAQPAWWQVECLRVMKDLRFVLPIAAREVWNNSKSQPKENVQ